MQKIHHIGFWDNIATESIPYSNKSQGCKINWLGKIEEWFFDMGQKRYHIQEQLLDGRIVVIQDRTVRTLDLKRKVLVIALKVGITLSVFGFFGMLLARAWYRQSNTFILNPKLQRKELSVMKQLKNNSIEDLKTNLRSTNQSLNLNFEKDGCTLLYKAVLSQDPELISLLLENSSKAIETTLKGSFSPSLISIYMMALATSDESRKNFKQISYLLHKAGLKINLYELSNLISQTNPNSENKLLILLLNLRVTSAYNEVMEMDKQEVIEEKESTERPESLFPEGFSKVNLVLPLLMAQGT